MTAKEYLQQIEILDELIDTKQVELFQLRRLATSVTVPADREAVQTSGTSDKVGNIVAKIVDLENTINEMIDEFIDKKLDCINIIDQIHDTLQHKVLHKHYVQYKTLVEIASEVGYSYQYILEIHKAALLKVEKIMSKNKKTYAIPI